MATKDLMDLIGRMEGWGLANSLATKNNNPGNLVYVGQAGAIGKDDRGFAIFSNPDNGWMALQRQIELDASRGLDLRTFINKYAPPRENNTSNYLTFLTDGLGVSADTPLSNITSGMVTGFDDTPGLDLESYLGSYDMSYDSSIPSISTILIASAIVGVAWYAS